MISRRWLPAVLVGAMLALAACSTVTAGRPMADPAQTGVRTTTTTPPATSVAPLPLPGGGPTTPAPTGPPQGLAATSCGDYVNMDDAAKRQVIDAIGQQNDLVALNPQLWVTLADAMCTFADPATLVDDVVAGGGFR
jgi:hypothetical protein